MEEITKKEMIFHNIMNLLFKKLDSDYKAYAKKTIEFIKTSIKKSNKKTNISHLKTRLRIKIRNDITREGMKTRFYYTNQLYNELKKKKITVSKKELSDMNHRIQHLVSRYNSKKIELMIEYIDSIPT